MMPPLTCWSLSITSQLFTWKLIQHLILQCYTIFNSLPELWVNFLKGNDIKWSGEAIGTIRFSFPNVLYNTNFQPWLPFWGKTCFTYPQNLMGKSRAITVALTCTELTRNCLQCSQVGLVLNIHRNLSGVLWFRKKHINTLWHMLFHPSLHSDRKCNIHMSLCVLWEGQADELTTSRLPNPYVTCPLFGAG